MESTMATKPLPKPRLSKSNVKRPSDVDEMTPPPMPPSDAEEILMTNNSHDENNGFSSTLEDINENSSVEKHIPPPTVEISPPLNRPVSLINGLTPHDNNNENNLTNSLTSPTSPTPIISVENPEYVMFLRPENSLKSKKRNSDLIWFSSGVPPPPDFLTKQKSPQKDENKCNDKTSKTTPTGRLYPDLDSLLLSDNNFLAEEFTKFDATQTVNNIFRPDSSPTNHSAPGLQTTSIVCSSSMVQPELADLLDDDLTPIDGHLTDTRLVFNDMQTFDMVPNVDNKSIASNEMNDDDSLAGLLPVGSRESLPSLPIQPRNPTPVIVPHPHRTSGAPVASNVCYVGWLNRLGQKKKDTVRRWCVLQNGNLSFYNSETDEKSTEVIPCKCILFVTVETAPSYSKGDCQLNDPQLPMFGIYYTKEVIGCVNGTPKCEHLSFYADCPDDRTAWLTFLAKSIVHGETAELCERIDRAGPVYLKQGTTAEWESGWLVMIGAKLLYSCQSDVCSFEIDIRKIIRLRMVEDITDHCPNVKAVTCHPFVITTEGSALYIQHSSNMVTEAWKTGIESILTQRTSILIDQRMNFDDVPVLVEKCINFIALHGMNMEGIHRLSGTSSKIRTLYEEFQKDPYSVHLRLDDYSVHDVASVLRKFFRQLREPLVTTKLRPEFIQKSCIDEVGTRRIECKNVLKELPKVNYRTLRKILGHLKSVADNSHVNKMSVQNLAAIFGPTLFSVDRDAMEGVNFTSTSQAINIVADMILYYNWVFDVDDSEVEKESRIQAIANDLNNHPHQLNKKPSAGQLLYSIYTVQRDGVCFNMPITNVLMPSDVCDFAVQRRKIQALRDEIGLFEVVCNGELKRLILAKEKVLDVISRWTTWPLEERRDNYLIVMLDFVTERVKNMADCQTLFPTCEVHFSESKSFKKFTFQYSHGAVVQYKDSKAKKELNQWKAENLLWYIGCEAKRQPTTRFCLTFLSKNDMVKRSKSLPFFGKTMCFRDEVEMYKWLCTVLLVNQPFVSQTDF